MGQDSGRFEDIPFTESADAMTRLIGQAIDTSRAAVCLLQTSRGMVRVLTLPISMTSHRRLAAATPLHPITTLVLPMLCTRYAQNDRSCLPSSQVRNHYHLRIFWMRLRLKDTLPTLKLYQVYDYC